MTYRTRAQRQADDVRPEPFGNATLADSIEALYQCFDDEQKANMKPNKAMARVHLEHYAQDLLVHKRLTESALSDVSALGDEPVLVDLLKAMIVATTKAHDDINALLERKD